MLKRSRGMSVPLRSMNQRHLGRSRERLPRLAELGEERRLERRIGRSQPQHPVAAMGVDVGVILREDLAGAVIPAERVVERDLMVRHE